MLGLGIFMRAQTDNATATPNKARGGLPKRGVTPDVTCADPIRIGVPSDQRKPRDLLFPATLADGHTMPSENDATPAASTKLPKLMDTLLGAIQRCYVLLPTQPSSSKLTLFDGHTRPSKIVATPSASTKVEKLMGTLSAYFAPKRRQLKVTL